MGHGYACRMADEVKPACRSATAAAVLPKIGARFRPSDFFNTISPGRSALPVAPPIALPVQPQLPQQLGVPRIAYALQTASEGDGGV